MKKSTQVELVEELRKHTPCTKLDSVIQEALAGEFHDYKNNKYVCGKVVLVARLQELGLFNLATRVKEGEFDEEPDDEDKEYLRNLLKENNMGHLKDLFKL